MARAEESIDRREEDVEGTIRGSGVGCGWEARKRRERAGEMVKESK